MFTIRIRSTVLDNHLLSWYGSKCNKKRDKELLKILCNIFNWYWLSCYSGVHFKEKNPLITCLFKKHIRKEGFLQFQNTSRSSLKNTQLRIVFQLLSMFWKQRKSRVRGQGHLHILKSRRASNNWLQVESFLQNRMQSETVRQPSNLCYKHKSNVIGLYVISIRKDSFLNFAYF